MTSAAAADIDPFNPAAVDPPRPDQVISENRLSDISQIRVDLREIGLTCKGIVGSDIYEVALIALRNAPNDADRIAANAAVDWENAAKKHTEIKEFSNCYLLASGLMTRIERIIAYDISQLHSFAQMLSQFKQTIWLWQKNCSTPAVIA